MSAIAGIMRLDGTQADPAALGAMIASMAHRGPDGSGEWSAGAVGLGVQLLASTPEALRERLPLVDEHRCLALAANARLDNRAALLHELAPGGSQAAVTDAELILAAYVRWGEECASHLDGDFAFALWDARARKLFCARDPLGVRPFYYYPRPDALFAFATEIKALLTLPEVPRRLDEARVAAYLATLEDDRESTFYRDIRRLPPGHTLVVTREELLRRSFWTPNAAGELRLRSDGEYVERFREVFMEAVRCRLRSVRPVGAALSGGLDSSAIACAARRLLEGEGRLPLATFSFVFDEVRACDERPFIQPVLEQPGFAPRFTAGDAAGPLWDWQRLYRFLDEPCFSPNLFLHWGLFRAAADEGVGVFLDGIDGDNVVSHGTLRLAELAAAWRWPTLLREARALARRRGQPLRFLLTHRALLPNLQPLHRAVRRRSTMPDRLLRFFAPGFARRTDFAERLRAREAAPRPRTPREEQEAFLTRSFLPLILETGNAAGAGFRLERRYPFLDRRLVELCLALPSEWKLRDGWNRFILREALRDVLPDAVRTRVSKSNLSGSFDRGLATHDRELMEAILSDPDGRLAEFVELPELRSAYDLLRSGAPEAARASVLLWRAAGLSLWLGSAADAEPCGSSAVLRSRSNAG